MNKKENAIKEDDVCYEGYLIKSPPLNQIASQSSWKKRYFVLAKSNNDYSLYYFKNQEMSRKSSPLGEIPIKIIVELCIRPDHHPKWSTLQKLLKRQSSENVILVQTKKRDYFFIGEGKSLELLHSVISDLRQSFLPESQKQICSGEHVKINLKHQTEASPSNQDDVIYASIEEVIREEQVNKQQRSVIHPQPLVEHSYSEETEHIYDVPKSILHRLSQPTPLVVNREKPRSYSLPTATPPDLYDVPRKLATAKWRNDKGLSADSGIYEPMASIRDWNGSASSINSLEYAEQIQEVGCGNNIGNKIIKETKLEKLNITVCQHDFKNNLSLMEVNDKVCVAHAGEECAFQPGDQIVAINKLQIHNVEEVSILTNRSMEEEVTATILRLPVHNENMESLRKELIKKL
ncbi:pleckstrin homology domain-containing family S member 1-like [Narcine bancroftii]|uniref:pleckstrin homology domain-containing family S member 1-like n=1 Tax=Narcine bancroftii TaxID=1343680 RepID=UPI003831086F